MSQGSAWERLVRGTGWIWLSERYRTALPANIAATVMTLRSSDHYHAKQGRSTARVRFDTPHGTPLSVYLKRHEHLPWITRVAAFLNPSGRHSPAGAEWAHLECVRALGILVPEVVAVGEQIGPWGRLRGFLMVEELVGCLELNEALPDLKRSLDPQRFAALKRELASEMARIASTLHLARVFHKDFYLCHFFLDMSEVDRSGCRLILIDFHRLGKHRLWGARWRWKDLAQLLYSTFGVEGIDDRDRLRFWKHYRRLTGQRLAKWQLRVVRFKAGRYFAHNH
jgi:lipopolysaccharide kinase (Kdo/WaaP) family protein